VHPRPFDLFYVPSVWRALLCLSLLACTGDGDSVKWHMTTTTEPAALLSVWGTSANDVWVVGGRSQLAGGPALLHLEGETWTRVDSGQRSIDLWWVFGFAGGDVFFTGSGGTILRYRGGTFEKMTTPRSGIIFGLWGAAADDLWAVGTGDDGRGIVWRYDGAAWQDASISPSELPGLVLKVHGQRADDVWISCAGGVALHWDGAAFTRMSTGTTSSLFSVVTTPDVVVAVGGYVGLGEILEYDGTSWTSLPSLIPVAWRGTTAGGDQLYAVGEAGAAAQRTQAGWSLLERPPIQRNFHAAWVDPQGGLWGVGGSFDTVPLTQEGFLAYYGVASPTEVSP
jgi:hypothetical protein